MLGLVSVKEFHRVMKDVAEVYDKEFETLKHRLKQAEAHNKVLEGRLKRTEVKVGELMDIQDSETNAYEKISKELSNIKRTKVNISALDKAIEKKINKKPKTVKKKAGQK